MFSTVRESKKWTDLYLKEEKEELKEEKEEADQDVIDHYDSNFDQAKLEKL